VHFFRAVFELRCFAKKRKKTYAVRKTDRA